MPEIELNELKRLRRDAALAEAIRAAVTPQGPGTATLVRPTGEVHILLTKLTREDRRAIQAAYTGIWYGTARPRGRVRQ